MDRVDDLPPRHHGLFGELGSQSGLPLTARAVEPSDGQRVVAPPPVMQACQLVATQREADNLETSIQHAAGKFPEPRGVHLTGGSMLRKKVERNAVRIDVQVGAYHAMADTIHDR